jgi:tetratricopeptide (TPR) repeat protein
MRKRALVWVLGCIAILTVVVALWMVVNGRQRTTVTLSDGTRITYLGATYGRRHTTTEWRFQWAWPPVQRIVHQENTPADTVRLWFRVTYHRIPATLVRSVAVTSDGRFCSSSTNIRIADQRMLPSGKLETILSLEYDGLPADGRPTEVRFYYYGRPQWASLVVPLPKAPVLNRVRRPEPLPAIRKGELLTVRLNGFRWLYSNYGASPFRSWEYNTEEITACPDWELTPLQGNLNEWEITNSQFAPLGAGYPLNEINLLLNLMFNLPPHHASASVIGNWDAPIYRFYVQLEHKPTRKQESFEFFVPTPPVAQLRQRGQLEAEARKAIEAGDYARAIKIWENAPAEFALQAHYWRGYAFAMQGDYPRAVKEFREASRFLRSVVSPYDTIYEVRLALVCCLLLQGKRQEAAQVARDYLQQVYQHTDYLRDTETIANAMCLVLPEAAPSAAQLEHHTRDWATIARQWGNKFLIDALQSARAVHAAAKRDYKRAIRLFTKGGGSTVECYELLLAWLHRQTGQHAQARRHLDNVRTELKRREVGREHLHGVLLARLLFPQESLER